MSDERLPDVWATRDFPILREITRRLDASPAMVYADALDGAIPTLSHDDVQSSLRALARRRYVDILESGNASGAGPVLGVRQVSGEAYLVTGLHPNGDDALASLVSALRQAAEEVDDEDERGRLRKAADSLLGIGRNVSTAVLTAWITSQIPT